MAGFGVGDEDEVVGDDGVEVASANYFDVMQAFGEEGDEGTAAALGAVGVDGGEAGGAALGGDGEGVGVVLLGEGLFPGFGAVGQAGFP